MVDTVRGGLPGTPAGGGAARPSVIQLVFREKGALYAAYMPVFSDGGLFVPTTREYKLGEDIYLLLSLPDDPQRYPDIDSKAFLHYSVKHQSVRLRGSHYDHIDRYRAGASDI